MFSSFRLSMAWVHTWFGLVLGFVLMVCFFFGSLSVFDREIDRWAIPGTRFNAEPMPSFDRVILPALRQVSPDADDYARQMPVLHDPAAGAMTPREALPADRYWAYITHRDPVLATGVRFRVPHPATGQEAQRIRGDVVLDPRNGRQLRDDALRIGSDWFYPMHYSLNWAWKNIGYFVVGLAALAMLVALITGVIIHRRLLREFFTLRPWKQPQRLTLDLHNLTGVVALPFHFFFAFTGLVIFAGSIYLPVTHTLLRPMHDQQHQIEARNTGLPAQRAGVAAPMASVDAMMAEARRRWAARDMPGDVGYLVVHHVGDANSYVSLYRAGSDRVALVGEGIHFRASSGEVIHEDPPHSATLALNEFLTGLHLQHFEHWLLRWLYVLGGLLGCVCIATGFVFFVRKRRREQRPGTGLVEAFAVATVTGMVIATLAMLIANRLLPFELAGKADWEKGLFWAGWLLALAHALWRSLPLQPATRNRAWEEQCLCIAGMAVVAVAANWLSTGDHLVKTVIVEPYWPVAGLDLILLLVAVLSTLTGWRLQRTSAEPATVFHAEAERTDARKEGRA